MTLAERPIRHALVLGGTGFLGAPLLQALVRAGIPTTCLAHRRAPSAPGVRILEGSIERFRWRTLDPDPPDVIFHLARIAARGRLRMAVARARNRMANERLLAWLASSPRPPLLVYVGGTLAYGTHGDALVTEETPLAPISFSRSYHAAERPWLRALEGSDAPVIIARPSWVLGPGSWFERYFGRPMREHGVVPLYGAGANWMSIVHVDDCARLLLHAARRATLMTTVNLFGGPPVRQLDLVDRLHRMSGLVVRPISLDELEASDGRAAREAFAFSARIGTVHTALRASRPPISEDLDAILARIGVSQWSRRGALEE